MLGTVFMHNRPASCSIETIGAMVASHFKGSIALFPFVSDQKTTQAVGLLDVVPYRNKKSVSVQKAGNLAVAYSAASTCEAARF
jgi:hypothetical protein